MCLTLPFHIDRLQYFCKRDVDLVYRTRKTTTTTKSLRKSFLLSNGWLFVQQMVNRSHISTHTLARHTDIMFERLKANVVHDDVKKKKELPFVYIFPNIIASLSFFVLFSVRTLVRSTGDTRFLRCGFTFAFLLFFYFDTKHLLFIWCVSLIPRSRCDYSAFSIYLFIYLVWR